MVMVSRWVVATALVLGQAAAVSITPTNWTTQDAAMEDSNNVVLEVSMRGVMVPVSSILPLTSTAAGGIPPPGLSGPILLANASNQLSITSNTIAAISCDKSAYNGLIGPDDIWNTAAGANAIAILWYSEEAAYCNLTGYDASYSWLYSMKSQDDTRSLLDKAGRSQDTGTGVYTSKGVYVQIGTPDQLGLAQANGTSPAGSQPGPSGPNDNNNNNNTGQNNSPLGPSPGTAVAMIILYSITGIITALFLIIIVTGAVRAHRHPERYGPRNIIGRHRQSRARGLARAMLETLPIVKVGDRNADANKLTMLNPDIELAEGGVRTTPETAALASHDAQATGDVAHPVHDGDVPSTSTVESGIAAAAVTSPHGDEPNHASDPDHQGCSICTEDFETGQDQRILPCDHRFHPECIDPWLLNVSGTCPLCRIDLRPRPSVENASEVDEDGNTIARTRTNESREGDALPPPLGYTTTGAPSGDRRSGVRRSLMRNFLGIGSNPSRMTRDERLAALREYRVQEARRRQVLRRESQSVGSDAVATEEGRSAGPEDEVGLRMRLRNVLRVRTRRTGGDAAEGVEAGGEGEGEGEERAGT
ncbi:hypothetical protein LTR62_004096 [Meristemomyces frigidus]|uniref:RING-type domain-containing protein n=1 Tax=Meristemomyces frigidus TaxID=1508187 RepID=A0AAN7TRE6_9PEZI|nr:hypothetical protein LTR62_004096 [Meristemomyces frigidus]